jgi:hypothetical protein
VAADHAGSKQSHREGQLHSIQLLDHNDLGAGPGGDMRKLGGDIAAADQDEASWQPIEFQGIGTGPEMLFAGDAEKHWHGAGGDRPKLLRAIAFTIPRWRASDFSSYLVNSTISLGCVGSPLTASPSAVTRSPFGASASASGPRKCLS